MAVTYRIDPDERVVYLTTIDDSSFREWREKMLAILSDAAYRPGFNFLSDRSQQTDVPDPVFARGAAEFLNEHSREMGSLRWAAVSSNPAVYGMQRMFSIYSELKGVEAQVFTNYEEALEWVRRHQGAS